MNYYYDTGSYSQNAWGRLAAVTFGAGLTGAGVPFQYLYSYNTAGRASNQPPGGADANGNLLTASGIGTGFTWDIENRLVWQGTNNGTYGYDPWGKRVAQNDKVNFYSISGQRLATYQLQYDEEAERWTGLTLYGVDLYFGGKLLQSNGVAVATDRLGSVRGNANGEKFAYYPYGKERTSTAAGREKFGTYYQDFGDQNYADQRYYNSYWPAFYSPDPAGLIAVDLMMPGSWNMYAYVNSDPINKNDPSGRGELNFCDVYPNYPICKPFLDLYSLVPVLPSDDSFDASAKAAARQALRNNPCDRKNANNVTALNWIANHAEDAAVAAKALDTTVEIILGLSALESGWGSGPFVVDELNNFFSQHAPAPGESGEVYENGNSMAVYSSYLASALGFVASASGQLIKGMTDPSEAAAALQNAGKYGINRDGSKAPNFVSGAAKTIEGIANRLDCEAR